VNETLTGNEIAIVGMAQRFPGASDLRAFWDLLRSGREAITFFTDSQLEAAGVAPSVYSRPDYVRAGAVLDGVEAFDAGFFGIPPSEAELIDPQHRLLLECAWEALEEAAHDPAGGGAAGVFLGVGASTYLFRHLFPSLARDPSRIAFMDTIQLILHNDKDSVATRVAYKLDLKGPALTVQTACSTSLVAVHLAGQSLLAGECDVALAGGASVNLPQEAGYIHSAEGIAPRDGHCRAFDARADGSLLANGVAVVALKRLSDALAQGDPIRAVIRGSAVNNDGAEKVGFTAPSIEGEARVISEALAVAQVEPRDIGYVEAHGTATPLGDPIEIRALTRAFRARTVDEGFCAIGSVKTNVGHLNHAAGAAGLIKTVLALEHGELPPSLNFERANPECALEDSPFYVNTELRSWKRNSRPRRAGVSSFGIGGTNAHVVLEEAPEREPAAPSRPLQLLVWSAKTPEALEEATDRLAVHLGEHPEVPLADVAHTLSVGRRAFEERRVLVCEDAEQAALALASRDPALLLQSRGETAERPVAFFFPDGSGVYSGMGRDLYAHEPVFRAAVDRCAAHLRERHGLDLLAELQPPDVPPGAQPRSAAALALFATGWGLSELWQSFGVRPAAAAGIGVGDRLAACVSGTVGLEESLDALASGGREPVRFSAAIERLWEDESRVLLELGPGRSLASFAMQHPRGAGLAGRVVLGALRSAHEPRSDVAHTLETLGKLWLAGVSVDWKGFWQHERRRRVALPTYPFQRQRYWVDIPALPATAPAAAASAAGAEDARRPDLADWFYAPVWSRSVPRPPRRDLGSQHRWLLLADGSGIADALARRLEARGAEVWTVEPGPAFETAGERCFRLSPGQHDHFHALGDALRRADAAPDAVVSLWSATPLPEPASPGERLAALDDQQARHFLAPLFLAQMLETFDRERPLPWWIASTQLHAVVGGEPVRAEKALLLGPCQVIPKEHPLLRCRSVDLEAGDPARAARDLEAEILRPAADDDPPVVAWRGGHRWVRGFEPVRLEASDPAPPAPLRPGGTYLLTGGLGGLGLALARHLASRLGANLVLLGRTPLPDGAPGDAPPDEETRRRLDAVRALEATGSRVLTAAADVADPDAVGRVVAAARERFGRIDGVFHLAGVPGAGLVQLKSADMAAAVLAPKVRGTLVLEAVLADDPPDFLALYSSIVAVSAGFGEVDYCAANAFLDHLAPELGARGRRVVAVGWSAWQWDAWQDALAAPEVAGFARDYRARFGISAEEGADALERALDAGLPYVLVTPQELDQVLALFGRLTADLLFAGPLGSGTAYPRPTLRTPYAEPRNEVERKLAGIWQRALGIEPVGIHDSFFELGGNSLTAIQVFSQLKRDLRLNGSIAMLFEAPTVATLAARLAGDGEATGRALDRRSERGRRRREARQRASRPRRGRPPAGRSEA